MLIVVGMEFTFECLNIFDVIFRPLMLFLILAFVSQIQHPRSNLNRFDLVITPHHDYYPLTPHAQEKVPRFLRSWITPREPPDRHVVCIMTYIPCKSLFYLRNFALDLILASSFSGLLL